MRVHLLRLLTLTSLFAAPALPMLISSCALETSVVDDDDLAKKEANQRLRDYEKLQQQLRAKGQ